MVSDVSLDWAVDIQEAPDEAGTNHTHTAVFNSRDGTKRYKLMHDFGREKINFSKLSRTRSVSIMLHSLQSTSMVPNMLPWTPCRQPCISFKSTRLINLLPSRLPCLLGVTAFANPFPVSSHNRPSDSKPAMTSANSVNVKGCSEFSRLHRSQ